MVWNKTAELFDVVGTPLDAPHELCERVQSLLSSRWPTGVDHGLVRRAFLDVTQAYFGAYPGLLACDTRYHDLRHALEAALVMTRLLDGYEKLRRAGDVRLTAEDASVGVLLALFHDIGMLRRDSEVRLNGARLMRGHERRSIAFAREYFCRSSLAHRADDVDAIMVTRIAARSAALATGSRRRRVLAQALGAADLLSQTADRCYLEKCRDFLFQELVIAGLDRIEDRRGLRVLYADPNDLLRQTPGFVKRFVTGVVGSVTGVAGVAMGAHDWLSGHFDGENPYLAAIRRNVGFLDGLIAAGDFSLLRRRPLVFAPV
jgi:hypothetical protein